MATLTNEGGASIIHDLIKAIREKKQYLSDIDGAIGDGDHGINMNKGFSLCEEELKGAPGNLEYALKTLSRILMSRIGGCMGPLYGTFFDSMAKRIDGKVTIDAPVFGEMLHGALEGIMEISEARLRDKTMMDVLIPADEAYRAALEKGMSFQDCLDSMTGAALAGRDSTEDMVAKHGRSSRLGERSRGVIDAGAASCCLILETLAASIKTALTEK